MDHLHLHDVGKEAKLLMALSKQAEAVALLKEAIGAADDQEKNLPLRLILISIYRYFNEWNDAHAVFNEIEDLSLLDNEWLLSSAFCAYWAKDYADAELRYLAAAERQPDDYKVWAMLGNIHVGMGEYGLGCEEFFRGCDVSGDSRECLLSAAGLLATCIDDNVRNGEEALRLIQGEKSSLQPGWILSALKAAIYAELGKYSDAIEYGVGACLTAPPWERETRRQRLEKLIERNPIRLSGTDYRHDLRRAVEHALRHNESEMTTINFEHRTDGRNNLES
ncbi:MAG: tetratricopeptide repeat protein [Planctomycetaceae bacterium]